jgi:hypothetical protein
MEHCKLCNEIGGHKPDCPVRVFRAPETGTADYRGRELELDLFDRVNTADPRYRAELARVIKDRDSGYVERHKAIALVKKFQPAPPENPKKDFFRELLFGVQDKLGVDIRKQPDSIRGYTAVGTPLDRFHGVDAFVTYTDRGQEYLVTLDATLRPEKLAEGHKADLMITDLPTPEEDEDGYLEAVAAYAGRIAELIRTEKERGQGYQRSA